MCFQEISLKFPYYILKNMYLAESNLAHCVVYCMTCVIKTFVEFHAQDFSYTYKLITRFHEMSYTSFILK